MTNPNLEMNFNVVEANALRQELQKAQAYINQLNATINSLLTETEELKKRLDASPF